MDDMVKACVLYDLASHSAKNFNGNPFEFKQALGSLTFASIFGYQALIHYSGLGVVQNHGRILNMDLCKVCPETTDLTELAYKYLQE